MWNKIACNRLIQHHTQLKQRTRHQKQLMATKSAYLTPQKRRPSLQTRQNFYLNNDRLADIDRENHFLLNRIQRAKSVRSSTSLSAYNHQSKMLKKNKQIVNNLKKKQLEQQNQRILKKLLTTSSSLKKLRIKTENIDQNTKLPPFKGKTVMAISGNEHFGKVIRPIKMKTEIVPEVQSRIEEVVIEQGNDNEEEMPDEQIQVE